MAVELIVDYRPLPMDRFEQKDYLCANGFGDTKEWDAYLRDCGKLDAFYKRDAFVFPILVSLGGNSLRSSDLVREVSRIKGISHVPDLEEKVRRDISPDVLARGYLAERRSRDFEHTATHSIIKLEREPNAEDFIRFLQREGDASSYYSIGLSYDLFPDDKRVKTNLDVEWDNFHFRKPSYSEMHLKAVEEEIMRIFADKPFLFNLTLFPNVSVKDVQDEKNPSQWLAKQPSLKEVEDRYIGVLTALSNLYRLVARDTKLADFLTRKRLNVSKQN